MEGFWQFFIIQVILIAVVLSVHTYLGLHIIRRGIIFSDLVLDQLAAFGVIAGIGAGIEGGSTTSYLISFSAVFIGAVLLAVVKPKKSKVPREAVIGIMYGVALVISIMASDKIPGGASYVTQTMSGIMLWISWPLVWITVIAYACLSILHYVFRSKIIGITERTGVGNEKLWDMFFFLTQGIITVLIVPIAGVLLAYSFIMIPAAIALLFTRHWAGSLALGWGVGFAACLIGLMGSYFFRLPYGPSLVMSLGFFFLCAIFLRLLIVSPAQQ